MHLGEIVFNFTSLQRSNHLNSRLGAWCMWKKMRASEPEFILILCVAAAAARRAVTKTKKSTGRPQLGLAADGRRPPKAAKLATLCTEAPPSQPPPRSKSLVPSRPDWQDRTPSRSDSVPTAYARRFYITLDNRIISCRVFLIGFSPPQILRFKI